MKKKIILTTLLVMVIAIGSMIGLVYDREQATAQTTEHHRLVGVTQAGMVSQQPKPARSLFYQFLIVISNPDQTESKTLEKIVITNAKTGEPVMEILPDGDPLPEQLGPLQVYERDSNQLGLEHDMVNSQWYTVEVYWTGGGEPLLGWTYDVMIKVEQEKKSGEWQIATLDDTIVLPREMTDYLIPEAP